jgi:hypothetical protein
MKKLIIALVLLALVAIPSVGMARYRQPSEAIRAWQAEQIKQAKINAQLDAVGKKANAFLNTFHKPSVENRASGS